MNEDIEEDEIAIENLELIRTNGSTLKQYHFDVQGVGIIPSMCDNYTMTQFEVFNKFVDDDRLEMIDLTGQISGLLNRLTKN